MADSQWYPQGSQQKMKPMVLNKQINNTIPSQQQKIQPQQINPQVQQPQQPNQPRFGNKPTNVKNMFTMMGRK